MPSRMSARTALAFSWVDWLAVMAQFESVEFSDVGADHNFYFGLRSAARPGLALSVAAAASALVVGVAVLVSGTD